MLTGALHAKEKAVCEKTMGAFEFLETRAVQYSHQGGRSERWRRDTEEDSTLWGIYESTEGWFCESNIAERSAENSREV